MDNVKSIRKQLEALSKYEGKLVNSRIKAQCICPHKSNNTKEPMLRMVGTDKDGIRIYQCAACGKKIKMKAVTQEDADNAFEMLDRIMDQMKLLDGSGKEENLEKMAKFQMQAIFFRKAYKARQEKNAEKNKNKNRDRRESTVWGSSVGQ